MDWHGLAWAGMDWHGLAWAGMGILVSASRAALPMPNKNLLFFFKFLAEWTEMVKLCYEMVQMVFRKNVLSVFGSKFDGLVQVILNVCILVLKGLKCTRSLKKHSRHTRAPFLLINHAHVIQWTQFETI